MGIECREIKKEKAIKYDMKGGKLKTNQTQRLVEKELYYIN